MVQSNTFEYNYDAPSTVATNPPSFFASPIIVLLFFLLIFSFVGILIWIIAGSYYYQIKPIWLYPLVFVLMPLLGIVLFAILYFQETGKRKELEKQGQRGLGDESLYPEPDSSNQAVVLPEQNSHVDTSGGVKQPIFRNISKVFGILGIIGLTTVAVICLYIFIAILSLN